MEKKKFNYGIIGAGHIGKYHIQQIQNIPNVNLIGVFDINKKQCEAVAAEFNTTALKDLNILFENCDAVSIATPALSHYKIAKEALKNSCHLFMEKPFTTSVNDAEDLIRQAQNKNLLIQVGHIERFNPAFAAFMKKSSTCTPQFIETHRLAPFNIRGTDTDVVLDLMIHDIDLILHLVDSPIDKVVASGVSVLSQTLDLVNARISFASGCVANLTASRISDTPLRKLRLFEQNQYVSINFQKHSYSQYQVHQQNTNNAANNTVFELDDKFVTLSNHVAQKTNALYEELLAFVNSIQNSQKITVNGNDGKKAIEVALLIKQKINEEK